MNFSTYEQLVFERHDPGILQITINRPEKFNATDETLHSEMARVWLDVDADPDTRVAVITGAGRAFSSGGDFGMIERMTGSYERVTAMLTEMADMVYNVLDCSKPIVSAINGAAVGLLKSRVVDIEAFIGSVRRVLEGGSVVDPALVEELVAMRRRHDPLESLSERERQVMSLVAEGYSNAGIAGRISVSEGTVEKHVRSIMMKLNLPEREDDHRRVLAVLTFLEHR